MSRISKKPKNMSRISKKPKNMSRISKKPKKATERPQHEDTSSTESLEQEHVASPGFSAFNRIPKASFTFAFLAILLLAGITYTACKMTPSSYGYALANMHAPEAGPVLGQARPIRSDEWSVLTPQVQAAVRNHFRRFNETSLYREDMRNYFMPPLQDWGLVFRPQIWLFFVTSPAMAFSAYWAYFMVLFLAGYYLLFLELGVFPILAAAASLALFFSGFSQFWWTTNGPIVAVLPWTIWVIVRPFQPIFKAALLAWIFTSWAMAMPYAPLLLDTAWAIPIVVFAFRPRLVRSVRDIAAVGVATLAASVLLYLYFSDAIAAMRDTVYPGHRISPPGNVPWRIWASQLFPYVAFDVSSYEAREWNICEIGTVGTYFPLLTACLLQYSKLRERRYRESRWAFWLLGAAFLVASLYQVFPVPQWFGRILLWSYTGPQRLFFFSGLLLLLACLSLWKLDLLSFAWWRIALFVFVGPITGAVLKQAYYGQQPVNYEADLAVCGIVTLLCLAFWALPQRTRMVTVLAFVAGVNIYGFGRFNPLQSAVPIFAVPETDVVRQARQDEAQSPGHYVVESSFSGAVLNGLGIRSVSHVQISPQLAFFRRYFPTMDAAAFNQVFNRYAHIHVTNTNVPRITNPDVIEVPAAAFLPPSNGAKVAP